MADRPPSPDPGDDAGVPTDRGSAPGMPRWVKVSLMIVIALALVFVILNLAGVGGGPGGHGPGRHMPSNGLGGGTPPFGVA